MEDAEFEEKEFEGPLYRELLMGSHRFATPGQVFENAFGIDAALEAYHPAFWDHFGYYDIPAGLDLTSCRWGWVWDRYGGRRDLPSFPVNLLIQAKRPQYLKGKRADFADLGIAGHYWRFQIKNHQQEMLVRLERQLRRRCLVVYSGPAFHTLGDLYALTEAQQIVGNSSFVMPSSLADHESWNYDTPGTVGIAASIPQRVVDDSPFDRLEKILGDGKKTDPKEDLLYLEKSVTEVAYEIEANPIAAHFLQGSRRLREIFPRVAEARPEIWSFWQVGRFFSLLGLQWLVYGSPDNNE